MSRSKSGEKAAAFKAIPHNAAQGLTDAFVLSAACSFLDVP